MKRHLLNPFFYKKRLFPIKSCTFPPLFFAVPQDNDYLCAQNSSIINL